MAWCRWPASRPPSSPRWHAWLRLKGDSAGARSLADLERAAERFGKSLGGSALRILVALATLISSKALPNTPAGTPAGTPSAPAPVRIVTSTRGTAAVAGAARAGWGIQVLPGGAMAIVPGAMAMSVVHAGGKGAGSAASGTRSAEPGSQAAGGKAAATKTGKPGPDQGGKPTRMAGKAGKAATRRTLRNAHLAGKTHPKTKVPFDAEGYPDFRAAGVVKVEVEISPTGTRAGDFKAANQAAGLKRTPEGYTWHHHQNGTTMQLVPRDIHAQTGHTGGFARTKQP